MTATVTILRFAKMRSHKGRGTQQLLFRERDNLEPVSRKELLQRMRDGLVTVIDIRPSEEFTARHLPGAINLPLGELKRRLRELPRDQEIVAYCRGPVLRALLRSGSGAAQMRLHCVAA